MKEGEITYLLIPTFSFPNLQPSAYLPERLLGGEMSYQHKDLAGGRWFDLSFPTQMAHIGSEVNRAISWKNKNNPDYSQQAFERSLELLYLTISDSKNKKRLRELTRVYEVWVDYFAFDNEYGSNDRLWQNYFLAFNYLARAKH